MSSVAFSPDGFFIVTGSKDKTARLWDGETGKPVAVLAGHDNEVESATFTPDGKQVLTASADGTARLWEVSNFAEQIETKEIEIKTMIWRCLTREQRLRGSLDPEPPSWCIELEKWPNDTQDWKDWLRFKRANANPPMPDAEGWSEWIASRRAN